MCALWTPAINSSSVIPFFLALMVIAAQLLEADPDIGLEVLDQMAEVDIAVGVGKRAGNEDTAFILLGHRLFLSPGVVCFPCYLSLVILSGF